MASSLAEPEQRIEAGEEVLYLPEERRARVLAVEGPPEDPRITIQLALPRGHTYLKLNPDASRYSGGIVPDLPLKRIHALAAEGNDKGDVDTAA